jgi:two-component system, cell cycle sensor histidine kinase and response regulator CckA
MRIIAAGSAVVLIVLGVFLVRPVPVVDLDYKVCDLLTGWVGPPKQSGRVVIVEIDEKSLAQFGRWPWPRDLLGLLTRKILDHGAAAVVLDMMFPQEDRGTTRSTADIGEAPSATNDEVLAGALSGRPVVVGYAFRFDSDDAGSLPCQVPSLPLVVAGPNESRATLFYHATGAVCSVPAISRAALGSGFLNAAPDRDGRMRRIPLVIEYGDRYYPSLALAALNVYRHVSTMQLVTDARGAWRLRLDNQTVPLEGPSYLRLRFSGTQRRFPYVSVADVLSGRVPEERLRGKIAIVGGSASGLQNPVVAPVNPLFPDVEIQATAIDNLLQGNSFRRPGDAGFWELALALLAGLTSTILLALLGSLWGALIILGLVGGVWAVCTFVLSSTGMLFSPLAVTAALACNLLFLPLLNYLEEKKRADLSQRQLVSTMQLSREALRESESRYQRLVENVNDAIIVSDIKGRLVFANRRFREWFGVKEAEVGNVVAERYVAPEWRSELRDRHDRRLRGETVPDHFEYEGIRPDGTRIWIEALVTKVEEDGRTIGTQAALRDITERKRIEAQYLQAQKMEAVGRLAGGIAHDFNNLLMVIMGQTDLLMQQLEGAALERAENVKKSARRAAELTRQLLAFSRKQTIHPMVTSLNQILTGMADMVARLVGEDIEVKVTTCEKPWPVRIDRSQFEQVIMNLVVNARDAMPNGGLLTLETENCDIGGEYRAKRPLVPAGKYAMLAVSDNGAGMSPETQAAVFEPFFTTKELGKGTGLGLSMVYGIVKQNNGFIWVYSELGKGTCFKIYLPMEGANEAAKDDEDRSRTAKVTRKATILLVEDEENLQEIISEFLKTGGHKVILAGNVQEACRLGLERREEIDLVLTDVVLKGGNGKQLVQYFEAQGCAFKVVYMSGYAPNAIVRHGVLNPGTLFLQKPFSSSALLDKIEEACTT